MLEAKTLRDAPKWFRGDREIQQDQRRLFQIARWTCEIAETSKYFFIRNRPLGLSTWMILLTTYPIQQGISCQQIDSNKKELDSLQKQLEVNIVSFPACVYQGVLFTRIGIRNCRNWRERTLSSRQWRKTVIRLTKNSQRPNRNWRNSNGRNMRRWPKTKTWMRKTRIYWNRYDSFYCDLIQARFPDVSARLFVTNHGSCPGLSGGIFILDEGLSTFLGLLLFGLYDLWDLGIIALIILLSYNPDDKCVWEAMLRQCYTMDNSVNSYSMMMCPFICERNRSPVAIQ